MLILALGCVLLIGSCTLVDLDNPPADGSGNGNGQSAEVITGPNTVPNDLDTMLIYLRNESSKVWNASGFTIFGLSGFQDCRLDDVITLNADGTFSYDGGETLCGAEDNQRERSGTWEYDETQNMLTFLEGNSRFSAEITGLNNNQIVLKSRYIGLDINGSYRSN